MILAFLTASSRFITQTTSCFYVWLMAPSQWRTATCSRWTSPSREWLWCEETVPRLETMPCGDSGAFLEALRMGGLSWGRRQWGWWGQERESAPSEGQQIQKPETCGILEDRWEGGQDKDVPGVSGQMLNTVTFFLGKSSEYSGFWNTSSASRILLWCTLVLYQYLAGWFSIFFDRPCCSSFHFLKLFSTKST